MIFSEAFGPASVPKAAAPAGAVPEAPAPSGLKVAFARSSRTVPWDAKAGDLLALALAQGVEIPFGCRAGNCGTCETAVRSGTVRYLREAGWKAQAGSCLVCVTAPNSDVELDA
jgi:ferredoxin